MEDGFQPRWDLETFFAGGSDSASFTVFMNEMRTEIQQLEAAAGAHSGTLEAEQLVQWVNKLQRTMLMLREAESFTACLSAENQLDRRAAHLSAEVQTIGAAFVAVLARFDQRLCEIGDEPWQQLLNHSELAPIRFGLDERRRLAAEKLPPEQEALVAALAVDGYHGWGELYNTIVSKFRLRREHDDGSVTELSAGQAANALHSADRAERTALFAAWEAEWGRQADLCSEALNRLAGFRLELYRRRGWEHVLKEPLAQNRMCSATLESMWRVVEKNKEPFVRYLRRKQQLLGIDRLSWHDVEAPLAQAGKSLAYPAAAQWIVAQFRRFSPHMADLAETAFRERWIEAEDRAGKRPGGFCTSFPLKKQTRIFMTFAGTASNVSTLAHELGHAYHQYVMEDMPALAQQYAMNVAETASTFAEMIVSDAALQQAASTEEQISLLEERIGRSVAFFMNIHARFLFETAFYEERKAGMVSVERLNELMSEAQRQSFQGALDETHPHFWASKLHFYLTDVPFYNFPYTFGYLFSAGIYAKALQEGSSFADKYVALLRDTGSMSTEQLASRHLGVDLTEDSFWQSAIDLAVADVERFMALTENA